MMSFNYLFKSLLILPFLLLAQGFAQDHAIESFPELLPDPPVEVFIRTEAEGTFKNPTWTGLFQLKKQSGKATISGKFTLPPIPSLELPFLLWIDQGAELIAPAEDVYLSCRTRTWGEFTDSNTVIRVTAYGEQFALVIEELPGESQPVTVYFSGESWGIGE